MHDLGPSQMEHNMNEYTQEFGGAMHEGSYHEYAGESPLQEILGHEGNFEYAQEYHEAPYQETYEAPYHEMAFEDEGIVGESSAYEGSWNEVLGEDEVLELTSELLEVQSEDELDRFLGKLFKRVGRFAKGIIRSPIGKMVGGALKNVAKVALPMAGKALGTFIGGPVGTMVGGQLANMAGQALGLELQEMAPQEADFAAARQFVRFATDMLGRAGKAPPSANPAAVVRNAVTGAAQRFAPGLLGRNMPRLPVGPVRGGRGRGMSGGGSSGTWVRRGRTIILQGV
jgi:hypothetical protein